MLLVDVHCHLHLMKDALGVVERSRERGLKRIITTGLDEESNLASLGLAKNSPIVRAAIGLYPSVLKKNWQDQLSRVKEQIVSHKDDIVAVAEIGLDKKEIVPSLMDAQRVVFEELLGLAEKLKLPVIIHSRKAEADVLDILDGSSIKYAILHSFGGKKSLHKRGVDAGYFFSIPANVTKSTQYQYLAKETPLSQIFTETDSPYQSPIRDQENEPANVDDAVSKIAELHKLTPQETANNIFMNYTRVFRE